MTTTEKTINWRRRFSKRKFFTDVGYTPHKGQVQIHAALETPSTRYCVAVCGTRFGKTLSAAHEMAYEALLPREQSTINPRGEFMGWCVGPDHDKANLTFDAVIEILRRYLKGHISVNKTDGKLEFTNLVGARSRIMRRTTKDAGGKGKLVGYAVDFMVVDEAASIAESEIWQGQLSTRLIDRKGRALLISSPRGVTGFFVSLFRQGRNDKGSGIVSLQLPTWVNPHIPKTEIAYFRRHLPSRVFRQEVGAELLANSGLVFPEDVLLESVVDDFEEPIEGAEYFASIDLAMSNDYTVQLIARHPHRGEKPKRPRIVMMDRFYKLPIQVQIARLDSSQKAFGECLAHVDESGIGKPIVEQMLNADMNVRGIITSAQGQTSKRNLVFNAAALVERNGIGIPSREVAPVLWEEFAKYQWTETPSGMLTAEASEGHDDTVASFLLLCWHLRASGTSGEGRLWHRGMATNPDPDTQPERGGPDPKELIVIDRRPDAEEDDFRVFTGGRRRGGGLFRHGLSAGRDRM